MIKPSWNWNITENIQRAPLSRNGTTNNTRFVKKNYHNELACKNLENLGRQFGLKFDNFIYEIFFVENKLKKYISNVDVNIDSVYRCFVVNWSCI